MIDADDSNPLMNILDQELDDDLEDPLINSDLPEGIS
jgi:hypothetical protein